VPALGVDKLGVKFEIPGPILAKIGIALDLGDGVLDVPIAAGVAVSLLGDGNLTGRAYVAEKDVVAHLVVAVGAFHPIDGIVKVISVGLRQEATGIVRIHSRVPEEDVVIDFVVLTVQSIFIGEAKGLPAVVIDDIVVNLVVAGDLVEVVVIGGEEDRRVAP